MVGSETSEEEGELGGWLLRLPEAAALGGLFIDDLGAALLLVPRRRWRVRRLAAPLQRELRLDLLAERERQTEIADGKGKRLTALWHEWLQRG